MQQIGFVLHFWPQAVIAALLLYYPLDDLVEAWKAPAWSMTERLAMRVGVSIRNNAILAFILHFGGFW